MIVRRKQALALALALGGLCLVLLLAACGAEPAAPIPASPGPEVGTEAPETATVTATLPVTPTASPGAGAEGEGLGPVLKTEEGKKAEEVAEAVANRTPEPTPTPDVVAEKVEEWVVTAGLSGKSYLGLSIEDWIDIAISTLVAIVASLLAVGGVKLLFHVIERLVRRSASGFDDAVLATIGSEVQWLVRVRIIRFALLRLDFWSDGLRVFIDDTCFVLTLGLIVAGVLKLIGFAARWYEESLESEQDQVRLKPVILLVQRSGYALVLIVALSAGLSHFGINITALSAALILVAVVVSLGAKDIIADAISGFIILLDQPFRVGDVIAIEELSKWGDVTHIGTRTTRIRTPDNRTVIVPNSKIGASQVVNYTFPDLKCRLYSDIPVAYGSDFDRVRRVAEAAVRGIQGVLADQPVDVLFYEYGVSARTVRVRWWIENMHQEKYIIGQVNQALEIAFDQAGIEMPVTTRKLNVSGEINSSERAPSPERG